MKNYLGILLLWMGGTLLGQQNIADSLLHQSLQRYYITHFPPGYSSGQSLPLVIMLHGGGGNYLNVQGFTRMNSVADQNNFVVTYPQGKGVAASGFSWADGRGTSADIAQIDDVGFIEHLVDTLVKEYNIDPQQVYLSGFSNGGFMTQRLVCEVPQKFAAAGALGCSMDTALYRNCDLVSPVPMMYVSGTADPEVPYQGGAMKNPAVNPVVPVDTAVQFWVDANQCLTARPVVHLPDTVTSDSSTVELYRYIDCQCNAEVYFYKVLNGGHTWPGVPLAQFPQLGVTNEDMHASFALWEFFSRFSRCSLGAGHALSTGGLPEIQVHPHPFQEVLKITSPTSVNQVTLYALNGKLVLTGRELQVNVAHLIPGPYFLKVALMDGTEHGRIVLKK